MLANLEIVMVKIMVMMCIAMIEEMIRSDHEDGGSLVVWGVWDYSSDYYIQDLFS